MQQKLQPDSREDVEDAAGVYVGESGIAGYGVFAQRHLQAGEKILKFDDSRIITEDNPLRPELGESDDHVDHLANGVLVYMYEPGRYLNHCCRPNAYCRHFNGERYLVTIHPIAKNEEIVVDYALNSAVPGYSWDCCCGATNCRRTSHLDFFALPLSIQARYIDLLDHWFIAEHRQRLNKITKLLQRPPL
jgi:hypothetical protein